MSEWQPIKTAPKDGTEKVPYAGLIINAGRYNDPNPSPRTILRREKLAREAYRQKRANENSTALMMPSSK